MHILALAINELDNLINYSFFERYENRVVVKEVVDWFVAIRGITSDQFDLTSEVKTLIMCTGSYDSGSPFVLSYDS